MSHLDKLPELEGHAQRAYYAIERFQKASRVSGTLLEGKSFVNEKRHYLPFFPIDYVGMTPKDVSEHRRSIGQFPLLVVPVTIQQIFV